MTDSKKFLCIKLKADSDPAATLRALQNPVDNLRSRWMRTSPKNLVQTSTAVICYRQVIVSVVHYAHNVSIKACKQTQSGSQRVYLQLTDVTDISDQHRELIGCHVDNPTANPVTLITSDAIIRNAD